MVCERLYRNNFSTLELMHDYPPGFTHAHKKKLWEEASQWAVPGSETDEANHQVGISRWYGSNETQIYPSPSQELVKIEHNFFTYPPSTEEVSVWHFNFADTRLFGYYDGPLFAQDEIQTTEHPVLASVREFLLEKSSKIEDAEPYTAIGEKPTPWTIRGAGRCWKTDATGIYGNEFARADWKTVRSRFTPISPPQPSNILAVAAPAGGRGVYDEGTVNYLLETLHVGFSAVRKEAGEISGNRNVRVEIHTGLWGCGAFGGNKTLTGLCQIAAAASAGIDRLVYHDHGGAVFLSAAADHLRRWTAGGDLDQPGLTRRILAQQWKWGVSNGN